MQLVVILLTQTSTQTMLIAITLVVAMATSITMRLISIISWGIAAKSHLNKVLLFQKRIFRIIYKKPFDFSSAKLFRENRILPADKLFKVKVKIIKRLLVDYSFGQQFILGEQFEQEQVGCYLPNYVAVGEVGAAGKAKIESFLSKLVTKFLRALNPFKNLVIDERVVGWKGRWKYKQYNAAKPKKHHMKQLAFVIL